MEPHDRPIADDSRRFVPDIDRAEQPRIHPVAFLHLRGGQSLSPLTAACLGQVLNGQIFVSSPCNSLNTARCSRTADVSCTGDASSVLEKRIRQKRHSSRLQELAPLSSRYALGGCRSLRRAG